MGYEMTSLWIGDIIRDQFRFISALLIFYTVDYSKSRSIKMRISEGILLLIGLSPDEIWEPLHLPG